MRYVMLICGDETEWDSMSAVEQDAAMDRIRAWFEKWSAGGHIAYGGEELDSARTAKTAEALFRRAEELAGRTGQHSELSFIRACRGVSEFLLGNFVRAHALLDNGGSNQAYHSEPLGGPWYLVLSGSR